MNFERAHNHTWRKIKSVLAVGIAFGSALLVITPLGLVFFYLVINGSSSVNWDFFTKLPAPVGSLGGGMANAIAGTLQLLGSILFCASWPTFSTAFRRSPGVLSFTV